MIGGNRMSKKNIDQMIKDRLNNVAGRNLENEGLIHDSQTFKIVKRNTRLNEIDIKEIDELMAIRDSNEPISSDDGTFTAYKKRVGQSGVDTERLLETGLIDWFYQNARQYLSLDLIRIRDELGIDLSAYAIRPAYDMYTVSTDEDFRYVLKLIEKYHEEKMDKESIGDANGL